MMNPEDVAVSGDGSFRVEPGVFVTFEESAADIWKNMRSFGWDLSALERLGKLASVDASPDQHVETIESGSFDLGALLAHLVLVPNPAHRAQGDFSLANGRVGGGSGARYTYAGVAVMSPRLVAPVQRGAKAPLAPLLYAAVDEQRLSGELFQGLWQDVGTPERLAQLETQLAART